MPPSAASCRSTGTSATPATRRRRARWSACRATWRPTSSRGGLRQPPRLPAATRCLVRKGQPADAQDAPGRPADRMAEEREVMRPLPAREPETDRRWVMRVPPDPHVRFDTNDYSLDPDLVGRRVEVRASQREIV